MASEKKYPRYIEPLLEDGLADSPVLLIHGPRQCGKTTLAKNVGLKRDYEYISFDDDTLKVAAQSDPAGFVKRLPAKIIIDEIQRVPEIFSAIKLVVDQDRVPGRFILTGSANILLLPKLSDSLAGRMEVLRLHPLSQAEISENKTTFLDDLFTTNIEIFSEQQSFEQLAEKIVSGGYPAALMRTNSARRSAWYRDYIKTLVNRDIQELSRISQIDAIPRLMTLAAGQTARLVNISDLAAPFKLSRPSIRNYVTLLSNIFLIEELKPWHSNVMKRLIKTPKLHLCDTGLVASFLNINSQTLLDDHTLFGQLLETYVYQEIKRIISWYGDTIEAYHYRDKDGAEVDIVLERGRQLAGVEVKLSSTVRKKDFRGLMHLQATASSKFKAGVILYTGDQVVPFGNNLFAVPLSVLWRN